MLRHRLLLELLAAEVLPPFALKHRLLPLPDVLLPPILVLTLGRATTTQVLPIYLSSCAFALSYTSIRVLLGMIMEMENA